MCDSAYLCIPFSMELTCWDWRLCLLRETWWVVRLSRPRSSSYAPSERPALLYTTCRSKRHILQLKLWSTFLLIPSHGWSDPRWITQAWYCAISQIMHICKHNHAHRYRTAYRVDCSQRMRMIEVRDHIAGRFEVSWIGIPLMKSFHYNNIVSQTLYNVIIAPNRNATLYKINHLWNS